MYKKKYLIFSHEFPPRLGGAGQVALDLATELTRCGHEVIVLTQYYDSLDDYQFKVIRINVFKKMWFLMYPIFLKSHDLEQYDQIVLNDAGAIYSAGMVFTQKDFSKTIVYLHGIERYLFGHGVFPRLILFNRFFLSSLKSCSKIISVSNFLKSRFFDSNEILAPLKDKVQVIHNGVDTKIFYYEDIGVLDEYKKNDPVTILSVSRLVACKGYYNMLVYFKQLIDNGCNYKWFIVGDGPYKGFIEDFVTKNNLDNSVFLLGQIHKSKLRHYYSACDYFWLLSELEESYGLVYMEALACKCIPIGRNSYGVKEVIKNGINGFLVDHISEVGEILSKNLTNDFVQNIHYYVNSVEKAYKVFCD